MSSRWSHKEKQNAHGVVGIELTFFIAARISTIPCLRFSCFHHFGCKVTLINLLQHMRQNHPLGSRSHAVRLYINMGKLRVWSLSKRGGSAKTRSSQTEKGDFERRRWRPWLQQRHCKWEKVLKVTDLCGEECQWCSVTLVPNAWDWEQRHIRNQYSFLPNVSCHLPAGKGFLGQRGGWREQIIETSKVKALIL